MTFKLHPTLKIPKGSKADLNHEIARFWSYKILVEMGVWKQLKPSYIDDAVIKFLDISHLCSDEELDVSSKELYHHLKQRLTKEKSANISIDRVLANNLKKISKVINLSRVELKILAFAIVLYTTKGLEDISDELGNLSLNQLFDVLSSLLEIPYQKVKSTLNSNASLFQSGLIKVDRNNICALQGRLELMDGLADALLVPDVNISDVFERYFFPASQPKLSVDNFDYIEDEVKLIVRYLESVKDNSGKNEVIKGANILIYGSAGAGKSELARAIAIELGFDLQEISMSDEDGDPIRSHERFSAFRLAQQVLKKKENNLIIFDEIEDVFPTPDLNIFGMPVSNNSEGKKAWINRLLEDNEVPTIWVSNEVYQIDDAYKRRFKFVLKMDNPPEKTRLKIIKESINTLPVTAEWLENLAKHPGISPALIAQTAEMVNLMYGAQSNAANAGSIESDLTQVLNNSLEVMGKKKIINGKSLSPIGYNIDILNPDRDIKDLVKGLKKHQEGRICLFGPAGTGKNQCLQQLEKEIKSSEIKLWLKTLQVEITDKQLLLYAPNKYVINHVSKNYLNRIKELVALLSHKELSVNVILGASFAITHLLVSKEKGRNAIILRFIFKFFDKKTISLLRTVPVSPPNPTIRVVFLCASNRGDNFFI